MTGLDDISRSDLRDLLSRNWMTHDAMWFHHAVVELGMDTANRLNEGAVRDMATIEIRRVAAALGYGDGYRPGSIFELERFMGQVFQVVLASFMKFTFFVSEPNVMRVGFLPGDCFAFKGLTRAGAIAGYRCAVMLRVDTWFAALGLDFEAEPALGPCTMHTEGRCDRTYRFRF